MVNKADKMFYICIIANDSMNQHVPQRQAKLLLLYIYHEKQSIGVSDM